MSPELGSQQRLWAPHTSLVGFLSDRDNLVNLMLATGGLIPMIPYFAMNNVTHALFVSIGITVVILLVFGFIKNYVTIKTKRAGFYGAVQTLIIGVLAAGT